jgi:hypothetical protein
LRAVAAHLGRTLALAACASLALATTATAREPVYVSEERQSSGLRQKPERIAHLETGDRVGSLTWTSWGRRQASAAGIYDEEGDDAVARYPVTVTLERIRDCGGYRLYTRGIVRFGDQRPARLVAAGESTVKLQLRCRVMLPWRSKPALPWMGTYKPRTLDRSERSRYEDLRWSGWNGAIVHGRGTLGGSAVEFTLSGARFCRAIGTLVYLRTKTVIRHDDGGSRTITRRITCQTRVLI